MSSEPQLDGNVTFAGFAILAGVVSLMLIVAAAAPAPRVPAELLAYIAAHQSTYVFAAVTVLVWATAAIPFIVALRTLLGARDGTLALAAMLLCAGGVLLLGFATFASMGANLAILSAADAAPSQAEATYQAVIWGNLSFYLSDPGLMILGLGQVFFARLAWKSRSLPRLVSAIGYLGGLAGLLTLAVYQTSALAAVQLGAFGIWGLATGIALLKRGAELRPA
jgi:Domain of unknown function (DUF4386)